MPYEFRILGPVGLGQDGEAMPLGPPKRQAMVAALLLEPNRPVPQSQLTKAMWSGPTPRSVRNNLRTHLSALRKVLGRRLRVHAGGRYELRVEEAELDATQFAQLTAAGRTALGNGQPMVALMQLSRALALWRGDAGAGVPKGTWLDARFVHLDQQRLEAFEDHVTARLYTHGFAEIAADLRRHLATWPTRERCWEMLMLALYRSGDPPAALDAYRQARETLATQLGIEPGPDLKRLHRAMLQRDPSLDELAPLEVVGTAGPGRSPVVGTAPSPPPELPPPPAPLPPAPLPPALPPPALPPPALPRPAVPRPAPPPEPTTLVGRRDERWALTAALRERPAAVVVSGPAGAGKSALVTATIPAVADTYLNGYVTVELSDHKPARAGPVEVLRDVLYALEDIPHELMSQTLPELADDYHTLMAGRRILVVLDGVTDATQVRPLLSETGPTVLVTSRRQRLGLARAWHLQIDPLAGREAAELLTAYAGAVRTGDEPEAVRELVRICDGLPLALRIAGEWLASRPELPISVFASHLVQHPLDGLHTGHLSVRDTLAAELRAVAAVDPLAARAFPLLADGEPHRLANLAPVLDEPPGRVFFALERLVDRWLAESPEPEQYRTTGLHRAYATELATRGR